MNIVYATNNAFVRYTGVSIISLMAFNTNLRIYVLYTKLNQKNKKKLLKMVQNKAELIFVKIDPNFIKNFPVKYHLKVESYLRLFIPEYIHEKKVLYLDGDTIIRSSLSELYNTDISQRYIAACRLLELPPVHYEKKIKKLELKSDKYFNSGVMLLNLELIKANKIFKGALNILDQKSHLIDHADQDLLNIVIDGNFLEIDKKYNTTTFNNNSKIWEPVIVHFIGPNKPDLKINKNPYKKEFYKYYKASPFYRRINVKISKPNFRKMRRKIKRKLFNQPIINRIYNLSFVKKTYRIIFKKRNGNIK